MKRKYTVEANRKYSRKPWTDWTSTDSYEEAVESAKYCESVGFLARIITNETEEE